ncbi:MAG: Thioredoxin reductase [Candidatus Amesbacteria bacterium GW2011_GWA2_47_11b]|uniref:Thioredoxin reductase n=3 Tax=Candidatus Amesiibacteriota TaxID=1752730 RepID=A0A0G1SJR4_9BACT|nr:MAG: Thioredoxin reductase [Microgenomates group bacterium GW2011_GWC1_46_20]KKU57163.1 MAG: Thioredoxin reductase [Candidatus Amesbacteria bacterium GW2011_GWA2_47_11b]KKU69719.1 MAG: Thioredoxin reductase [Candidatus Amesbacteria bacterium GW2011_GWA1_47_20]KKU82912.1 MAG: Thioredoxin reductase [Candidatus Amesbacteria bacterium GW2011_GWC2_47_8]
MTIYDVIIIGSGPAGLTAGIYTSRANLKTLMVAGSKWGGQLMLTEGVENFPGFPEGIQGPELMTSMRKQAEKHGVEIVDEDMVRIEMGDRPYRTNTTNRSYRSRAIIIATGAATQWLNVPGEQELIGRGVSSCAPCDAPFFKGKRVIVVGGGDAAMEEALVLTKFADEVTIVHRRSEFRASQIMQERVKNNSKIKIKWNTEISEIVGKEKIEKVKFKDGTEMEADGVFVAIGHKPASKIFEGKIDLDEKDYIKRQGQKYLTMSNVEGVFVAGDVHDYRYRQAITAAGYGCEAALDVERWLSENGTA